MNSRPIPFTTPQHPPMPVSNGPSVANSGPVQLGSKPPPSTGGKPGVRGLSQNGGGSHRMTLYDTMANGAVKTEHLIAGLEADSLQYFHDAGGETRRKPNNFDAFKGLGWVETIQGRFVRASRQLNSGSTRLDAGQFKNLAYQYMRAAVLIYSAIPENSKERDKILEELDAALAKGDTDKIKALGNGYMKQANINCGTNGTPQRTAWDCDISPKLQEMAELLSQGSRRQQGNTATHSSVQTQSHIPTHPQLRKPPGKPAPPSTPAQSGAPTRSSAIPHTPAAPPKARTVSLQQAHYDFLKEHFENLKYTRVTWDAVMKKVCWNAAGVNVGPSPAKGARDAEFQRLKTHFETLKTGAQWDQTMQKACEAAAGIAICSAPGNAQPQMPTRPDGTPDYDYLRTSMKSQVMTGGHHRGKTIRTFWDAHDPLSNYAYTPFKMNLAGGDFEYECGEQAFQEAKIRYVATTLPQGSPLIEHCKYLISRIRKAPDGETARDIAKAVNEEPFPGLGHGWGEAKQKIMQMILKEKARQCSAVRDILMSTADTEILVEASEYDNSWGVGLNESDPKILDSRNWGYDKKNEHDKNHNLLGYGWMAVRSEIRKAPSA